MSQAEFTAALLNPDLTVPNGLVDAKGRPAGRRFSVYRNTVAGSLTEALQAGFPVVQKLLGTAYFKAMAGIFRRAHPPTSRIMMLYGAALPDFLANFPPLAHLPYLADVARLEQSLREAYHAADAPPLTPNVLASFTPDRFVAARLRLAPALRLVVSDHPIIAIWRANRETNAPVPKQQAEAALILRPEFDPAPHLLPPGGAAFVASLLAGNPVGKALDAATNAAGARFDLNATLGLLIGGGAIVKMDEERQ